MSSSELKRRTGDTVKRCNRNSPLHRFSGSFNESHQSVYSDDSFCPLEKQYEILKLIMQFYHKIRDNYNAGVPFEKMTSLSVLNDIAKLKWAFDNEFNTTRDTCKNFIQEKMEPDILGFD